MSSPAVAGRVSYVASLEAIVLSGPITSTNVEDLKAAYEQNTPKPSRIYVDSPGGDFYAAVAAGEWIRATGLDTYAGLLCESACAYLWLGGAHRFANHMVSIHAPYVRTSQMTVDVPAEGLIDATWYLARLGYGRPLIDAIFAVGTTESDETFPITGPNTHYLGIAYQRFVEKPFSDELAILRQQSP